MLTETDKAYIDGYIAGHMHAMHKLQLSLNELCEYSYINYLKHDIEKALEHKGEEDEGVDER